MFFRLNEEHTTIREIIRGQYIVTQYWYSTKCDKTITNRRAIRAKVNVQVTVKIEKLNPTPLVYVGTKTLDYLEIEATFLRFRHADGFVVETNDLSKMADNAEPKMIV